MQLDAGPGFTGHASDVATGLTNMQQRYMDQELGRFLTPDPVGPEEDFINHFNRYNYALNNPVRYTDPDGTCPVCLIYVAYRVYSAYDTATSAVDNVKTIADPNASAGQKLAAGAELAGSLAGGKGGREAVAGIVKGADKVGDTVKKANPVADAARSGKREIKISDGYKTRTDSSTKGEGGSHTHVYDPKGKEVARVNGNGGYSESHGGKPLQPPSALPKGVRNDVNRIITNRPEKKP